MNYRPDGAGEIITTAEARTVGATGRYATLADAFADLAGVSFGPGGTLELTLQQQTHAVPSQIVVRSPHFGNVTVKGPTPLTLNIASIQSSSGTSGNYSVILNVSSIANVQVGDYILVQNPAGGVNPLGMAGAHKVTNVDAVNTRITVTNTTTATVPSGAVAQGSVPIIRTIISMTANGFLAKSGAVIGQFRNVVLEGNNTSTVAFTGESASSILINGVDVSSIVNLGFAACGYAISVGEVRDGARVSADYITCSGINTAVIAANYGSTVHADSIVANGCAALVQASLGCFISVDQVKQYGGTECVNASQGCVVTCGLAEVRSVTGTAFTATKLSFIDAYSPTLAGNAANYNIPTDVMSADGSSITTTGVSADLSFGYIAGQGGTVAQATSKDTGVAMNKQTGEITMNAAALAADTTVSFTLTNNKIAAGDHVLVSHISGGTLGAYNVQAGAGGAGSVSIAVRNVTPGSLSEAPVLKFTLIKSATA